MTEAGAQLDTRPPPTPPMDDFPAPRRSARARRPIQKLEDEGVKEPSSASICKTTGDSTAVSGNSGRPKRKAAAIAEDSMVADDDASLCIAEILKTLSPDERKEYAGWVELESDPAIFDAMLQEMGTSGFKVQELFSLDSSMLEMIPQPVHGLIFLSEYQDSGGNSDGCRPCPDELWFGNQKTVDNACATVAVMNIIMNAKDTVLGPDLLKFKNATKTLPPPHRGHLLDRNSFIRGVHNTVARRIDLVDQDLLLDNQFESSEKLKEALSRKRGSKRSPKNKRTKTDNDTAYHYTAYVPVNGKVWELDGLQTQPRYLGICDDKSDWLSTASEAITERMERGGIGLSYNLVAVSQSPLAVFPPPTTAANLACRVALHQKFHADPAWSLTSPVAAAAPLSASPPSAFTARISAPDFRVDQGLELWHELGVAEGGQEFEFEQEIARRHEALEALHARNRDFTPAIHVWVSILAAKGVLRDMIAGSDRA